MPDDAAMPGDRLVDVRVTDGIAWITLNDPARRNCVSARMSLDLADVCEELAGDPAVRVAVITGAGSSFSSGGDIDSLTRPGQPLEALYRGFSGLAALPVPVLAAVNGPAVGAGMNFALACDVIVAGSSARFDPRFLDVGIHPGGGHLWRLQQLVGRQAAAAMVIFGENVTAGQAERLGLVWRVVADEELAGVARELASRVAGRSHELVRRTKASLGASTGITQQRLATDLELVAQEWSMSRPAFTAGVAALRDRLGRSAG
jgi:enoyl-CoA hydratase/carnithine racemase